MTITQFAAPAMIRLAAGLLMLACAATPGRADDDDGGDDDVGFLAEQNALPELVDGRFVMPPLAVRSTDTSDIGNGKVPDGFRSLEDRPLIGLPESGQQRGEDYWTPTLADWAAPNTWSMPRFFEDRMLERHGHERFGCAQPLASGVRFFATVPMLPYLAAITPPCECEYTLGYYRPGSCAPMVYQRPPWDRRAIIAESAAVATGMIVIP